jgi:hydroxyacylglutathione hydrolase
MKTVLLSLIMIAGSVTGIFAQTPDNYSVDKLGDDLYRIQTIKGFTSTMYMIVGTEEALLIDTGAGQEGLKEIVDLLAGNRPVKVVLTHGHGDHSAGLKYFSEVWMHIADTAMLPADLKIKRHYIQDGCMIDLGNKTIDIIGVPGHTPGSVVFMNKAERYMMTGDAIGSGMVWMQISDLPLTVYLESVKKLEGLKDQIDVLYVGHSEQSPRGLAPQYITDMRIVTEKVIDGTAEITPFDFGKMSGKKATYGSATLVFAPERVK